MSTALETRAGRVQALGESPWLRVFDACGRVHNPRVMRSNYCPPLTPSPSKAGAQRICTGMVEKMAVDHGHGPEGSLRKWNYNRGDDCEKAHSVRLRLPEAFRLRKGYPDYPCENNGC